MSNSKYIDYYNYTGEDPTGIPESELDFRLRVIKKHEGKFIPSKVISKSRATEPKLELGLGDSFYSNYSTKLRLFDKDLDYELDLNGTYVKVSHKVMCLCMTLIEACSNYVEELVQAYTIVSYNIFYILKTEGTLPLYLESKVPEDTPDNVALMVKEVTKGVNKTLEEAY